jgi:hypothetical protein
MRLHRLTHRSINGVCALGATAAILLVLAVTASARPIDTGPRPQSAPAPTIIEKTDVAPAAGGPGTIAWVLIAGAAGAALIGAGYLGACIAIRMSKVRAS